jgi:endonuclease III related protein
MKEKLMQLYHWLLDRYGSQAWWIAEPFEIMIGAILTQNTAWSNVEKTLMVLKQNHCMDPGVIVSTSVEQLELWLKSSGYFRIKTQRLKNYCHWYLQQGGFSTLQTYATEELRQQLLNISGIGPETADDILLYAFDRAVFVIDHYTRRLLCALNLISGKESYEQLRNLFEMNLLRDVALFKQFHALIVSHAKHQRKTKCFSEPTINALGEC